MPQQAENSKGPKAEAGHKKAQLKSGEKHMGLT